MNKNIILGGSLLIGFIVLATGVWIFRDKIYSNRGSNNSTKTQMEVKNNNFEAVTNTPSEVVTDTVTSTPLPQFKDFSMNIFDLQKKIVGKLSFKYPLTLNVAVQEQDVKCTKPEPGCLPYYASQAVISNDEARLKIGTFKAVEVTCVAMNELKKCRKLDNNLVLVTNECYPRMPRERFTYARIYVGNKCGANRTYVLFLGDIKLGRGVIFNSTHTSLPIDIADEGTFLKDAKVIGNLDVVIKTAKIINTGNNK